MACKDCFKNCGDKYTSDKCVEYTGPDIEALGICQGDTLSIVEAAIIDHLTAVLDGTGIELEDVTLENCPWLKAEFIGKDPTLVNLIQLLIDANCTLKELIDQVTPPTQVFDTKCLTGLSGSPTSLDILQAAVNLLCTHETTIAALPNTYVKITDLNSLVTQIINSSSSTTAVPKLTPLPYIGPLSNFDNTGKGIVGEYVGWYIMNGLNGTQDWRGRSVVGAIRNVPGGSPDAAVDPAIVGSGVDSGTGDKFGEAFHKLTLPETPAHTHTATDTGHYHTSSLYKQDTAGGDQQNTAYLNPDHGAVATSMTSLVAYANITVGSSGGGVSHENRQPSVAAIWIVKL